MENNGLQAPPPLKDHAPSDSAPSDHTLPEGLQTPGSSTGSAFVWTTNLPESGLRLPQSPAPSGLEETGLNSF